MADAQTDQPGGRPRAGAGEPPPLPEQARIGLLNYITAHSLDDDYAVASRRRGASDAPSASQTSRRVGRGGVLVLVVFGLLVATAAVQTARSEPVQRSSRESLLAQASDRREALARARDQLVALDREIEEAQAAALEASEAGRALQDRLDTLGVVTGAEAATGPGVRIEVDDAPDSDGARQLVLDTDLQIMVNGLWVSGAEAISINGQRLTALSAIRVAGEAITVNTRSLARPYVVTALGDPDQLAARFLDSEAGAWWLNLRSVYDLEFAMTTEDSLTVPDAPAIDLRFARPTRPG
jgi:uncharacterized protein YlxW (UPF0749 family)